MQPQSPNDPSHAQHSSEYDFIMNPTAPPSRTPLASNSLPMRILVVVIGVFVLMIVAVIVIKLLGASGGFDKKAMLTIAQDQTEIVRVADTGVQDGVSQATKNFAITTKLSVASQQSDFLTYLGTKGYKPKDKELILTQSPATDTTLQNAKSSSTFDSAFKEVMQQLLTGYQKDLNAAYGDAGASGKTVLKQDFNGAQLLLTQQAGL